jgi:hypothetical protein
MPDLIITQFLQHCQTQFIMIQFVDRMQKCLRAVDNGITRAAFDNITREKLHNRFQIGKDKYGKYKFFDYEEVKHRY